MLRSAFLAAALALSALPAAATPHNTDTAAAEMAGEACAMGDYAACDHLLALTGGHCAGPAWSGCDYGLELRAVDNGLMTWVPGYGPSRIETVEVCLQDAGVSRYQDLITDSHFEVFGGCLEENT